MPGSRYGIRKYAGGKYVMRKPDRPKRFGAETSSDSGFLFYLYNFSYK